jgi:large subunit ribosomal protein L15
MKLNNLNKVITKSSKRLGRGLGSGKGKTGGRGQKGQKARGKVPAGFSGGGLPLFKKLPLLRGWGNRKITAKPVVINLGQIGSVMKTGVVNIESLVENGLVKKHDLLDREIKVLGDGEFTSKLIFQGLKVSKQAQQKIEQAGGQVE